LRKWADNTDTRFGFNTGGGIDYFLNRTVALTGEGRYHAINDARGEEPSGVALTVGLKTYF
jgi:opacity protein-like surface antigen